MPKIVQDTERNNVAHRSKTDPAFIKVLEDGGTLLFEKDEKTGKVDVDRRCTGGLICDAQTVERLKYFAGRDAFDIEGLGEKQIELFFENEWVKEPADIFTLQARDKKINLKDVEGYGETSVRNLYQAIESRREISLERFIYALGIRHVGETTAIALARGYGSWKAFHDASMKVMNKDEETRAEMDALDQIGDTVIDASVQAQLQTMANRLRA